MEVLIQRLAISARFFISSLIFFPIQRSGRSPTRYTMVSYKRTYLLSNLLRFMDNPGFHGWGRAFRSTLVYRHSAGVFLLPSLIRYVQFLPAIELDLAILRIRLELRTDYRWHTFTFRDWEEKFKLGLHERRKKNKALLKIS